MAVSGLTTAQQVLSMAISIEKQVDRQEAHWLYAKREAISYYGCGRYDLMQAYSHIQWLLEVELSRLYSEWDVEVV